MIRNEEGSLRIQQGRPTVVGSPQELEQLADDTAEQLFEIQGTEGTEGTQLAPNRTSSCVLERVIFKVLMGLTGGAIFGGGYAVNAYGYKSEIHVEIAAELRDTGHKEVHCHRTYDGIACFSKGEQISKEEAEKAEGRLRMHDFVYRFFLVGTPASFIVTYCVHLEDQQRLRDRESPQVTIQDTPIRHDEAITDPNLPINESPIRNVSQTDIDEIIAAARNRNPAIVNLLSEGRGLGARRSGKTALMLAAEKGQWDICAVIIEKLIKNDLTKITLKKSDFNETCPISLDNVLQPVWVANDDGDGGIGDVYEQRALLEWVASSNQRLLKEEITITELLGPGSPLEFPVPLSMLIKSCPNNIRKVVWDKPNTGTDPKTGPEPKTPQGLVGSDEENFNLGAENNV